MMLQRCLIVDDVDPILFEWLNKTQIELLSVVNSMLTEPLLMPVQNLNS